MLQFPMKANVLRYNENGSYFFFDVDSGILGKSSPMLDKIIEQLPFFNIKKIIENLSDKYSAEDIESGIAVLNSLHEKQGMFISRKSLFTQGKGLSKRVSHLWLNVAHDCNMRCIYCYAHGGNYGGEILEMNITTAKKCIDYWKENLSDGPVSYVSFFGGEPFMNREVIKFSIEYIKELLADTNRKLVFNMTTNGTIYDEAFVEFLADNNVELLFSIDGNDEIQNHNRPLASGIGSYKIIENNIPKFKNKFKKLRATIVLTKENASRLKESVMHLWNLGFNDVACSLAITSDENLYVSGADLPGIHEQISEINQMMYENIRNRKHCFFSNTYKYCVSMHNKLIGAECSFQTDNALMFTPSGDIHKCHRLIDCNEFSLGNISNAEKWEDINKQFVNPIEERPCNDCWALQLCGGGCAHEGYVYHNDLNTPYDVTCNHTKFMIEDAFKLYARVYMHSPSLVDEVFSNNKYYKRL